MVIGEKEKQLIEKFLRRVPLFSSFSDKHLNNIIDDFKIISVKKGDDVVFQSDEGTDLFIVLKGKVKASLLGPDGEEFVLTTFNEGDFFGEMSLIDGKSRSANIMAEAATSLAVLKRDRFIGTMKQDPSIAINLLSILVERLRKSDEVIESLVFLDVSERLMRFLMHNAVKEGGRDKNGTFKIKKYTHKELASSIGASREAVSKALKVLSTKGTVTENEGYFLIQPDS
ncbi:MAG: Crp/Fnr family transcriptional regulator [Nitrospirae bacterium]|nr:Crp/Fnr family transcriptional regulator [Nitrospirota bacterium]